MVLIVQSAENEINFSNGYWSNAEISNSALVSGEDNSSLCNNEDSCENKGRLRAYIQRFPK
ncbi:hypothetical protein BgiBS90_013289, partial [Biomphalaria glabrata]